MMWLLNLYITGGIVSFLALFAIRCLWGKEMKEKFRILYPDVKKPGSSLFKLFLGCLVPIFRELSVIISLIFALLPLEMVSKLKSELGGD